MPDQKINLLNFDRESLRQYFSETLGEKPFHADQVIQWIHQYGITDFTQMTNLSKTLREFLKTKVFIGLPEIITEKQSLDGTRKWLLQFEDNERIEMVFIPEKDRGTLCISSQVGCALGCSFCATGAIGFRRNLTVAEIISQVFLAVRLLSSDEGKHDRAVTNVVFMGMGEPLLNLDHVLPAIHLLLDDLAYNFSKYKVTVSTAGIVPAMRRLRESTDVALAVSLHAPNNVLRDQLVPINKKYPLELLISACREYFADDLRRKISFEYVMIAGFNDQLSHARALVQLVSSIPCKFNLIPYNENPHYSFHSSSQEQMDAFRDVLISAGITTITRRKRGADIDAACGQLAGSV